MPEDHFAGVVAESYDDPASEMFDADLLDATVGLLADLAGEGAALELGVGTGRIALPLSARGVPVHGIDLSPDMIEVLRTKPGAERVTTTVGDFATTRVEGRFSLAYLVFNTITNLTSQDEQVACFENVAAHLEPGGHFLIEVFVPVVQRIAPGDVHHVFHHGTEHLGFDEYDVATQQMYSHHYLFEGDRYRRSSVPFRYVWPSELDLMARIAGLRPKHRWADWDRSPFTATSESHVSVWEKPA